MADLQTNPFPVDLAGVKTHRERLIPFTPIISGLTTAGVGTYTQQIGNYIKVDNRVDMMIQMVWTAHTGTGQMSINIPLTLRTGVGLMPLQCIFTTVAVPLIAGDISVAFATTAGSRLDIYTLNAGTLNVQNITADGILRINGTFFV